MSTASRTGCESSRWIRVVPLATVLFLGGCVTPVDPAETPTEVPARPLNGGLHEATDATCADGLDNDRDGYVDCDDRACRFTPSVTVCAHVPSAEVGDRACSDGIDNDGDPFIDCEDNDCLWNGDVTVCDRDRDGFTPGEGDCFDHPILDISRVVAPNVPEMCGDGEDNDCDGTAEEAGCIQLDLGLRDVRAIYDGDTIDVDGLGSVRLKGIDTPETYEGGDDGVECYGPEAKARTIELIAGRAVRVVLDPVDYKDHFRDLYGRLLGHVYVVGEIYLNGALVGGGYACVWSSYACSLKVELLTLQSSAQAADIGLWGACGPSVCF